MFYINSVLVEAEPPAEGDAVEELEVAPAAVVVAPAGVYNLQGAKVADSIDAVSTSLTARKLLGNKLFIPY